MPRYTTEPADDNADGEYLLVDTSADQGYLDGVLATCADRLVAERLAGLLNTSDDQDNQDNQPSLVLEAIRDTVRSYFPNADYVTVPTDEWENGYFFSFGLVSVSKRGEDVVDTSKLADELRNWEGDLTDEFGPVGRNTRLLINLDTLEAELNP